jgi:hypothetical protein
MTTGLILLVICFWLGLVGTFRALIGWRLPTTAPRHSPSGRVTVDEIRARLAAEIERNPALLDRFHTTRAQFDTA